MDITAPRTANYAQAYRDIYDRAVVDAAFLWLLRSIAVDQPHYTVSDIAELEQRLDAQLDLLMTSIELGWEACEAALALQQPGEAFTATVVAMRSHDMEKIKTAIQSGLAGKQTVKGLISALGWLPAEIASPWVERLLKGKDLNHKFLGVAASSVRREDPGELLTDILKRDDCRTHVPLYARALRLVGELRRQDLMPALQLNISNKDPALAFWANWSAVLLGQQPLVKNLRHYVLAPGPHQRRAIQLAFRVLPVEQGREWISALAQDPANSRAVVTATGVLGDPHAVNWLISRMADPNLARLAGEAFTLITGVDLEKHNLTIKPPANLAPVPNDDANDHNVGLDEDENLPWPHPEQIATLWRNHGQHFLVGRRYFLGKPITPDWLKSRMQECPQRQRHAAVMELALVDPQSRLINTRAKVFA
jgi:uncharacterized protein (TIGR02270 family)